MPVGRLLVTVYSEEPEWAKVLGVITATLTAGLAVGLVPGGVITSTLGWRWRLPQSPSAPG